jgi:Rrf2 family protein
LATGTFSILLRFLPSQVLSTMKLSKGVLYAIQALTELAVSTNGGVPIRCASIAGHARIPKKYLAAVLGKLVAHRILISCRGSRGGYCLARSADAIKLIDVIEAVNGPIGGDWPAVCTAEESPAPQFRTVERSTRSNSNSAVLERERPKYAATANGHAASISRRRGAISKLTDALRRTLADVTIGQLIDTRTSYK